MSTTTRPQTAATSASRVKPRREARFGLAAGVSPLVAWLTISLHRPHQHGRSLDDGDCEKQQHQHAERQRDGDGSLTAGFLLRLGEDNSILLPFVVHCL